MSFENGYDINDYISKTIKFYKEDNRIFDKTLAVLDVFMKRKDWPLSYKEFDESSIELLGINPESLCMTISAFESQSKVNENLINWDKDLDEAFKNDIKYFKKIILPISQEYYSYINNPLGISNIINIDTSGNQKLIRLIRTDGKYFDVRMNDSEIKQLIEHLNRLIRK